MRQNPFNSAEVEIFIPERSSYSQGIRRLLVRLSWRQRVARWLSLWFYDWKAEMDCRLRMKAKCERAETAGHSMNAREWSACQLEGIAEEIRCEPNPGDLGVAPNGAILPRRMIDYDR